MKDAKPVTSKVAPPVVHPKPDNPARKFMTKAEAVADNKKRRERAAKLDDYKKQLEAEEATPEIPDTSGIPEEPKKKGRPKKSEE